MARIELKRKKIGSLECMVAHQGDDLPTVILFHGYGADMNDLAPLAGAIPGAPKANWVFPNGHISIDMGGYGEARAWFPLRIAEMQAAMEKGVPIDFSRESPPGMKRAREAALELIRELKLPAKKLVIGGFSQGAILATDVVMHLPEAPAGLVILSGTVANSAIWEQKGITHKGLKFFMSHGNHDEILPIQGAQTLQQLLSKTGWSGKLISFHGGHGIPPEVLIQLGQFLRVVLA